MTTIRGPILREIEKFQSGISLPPSADKSDYEKCRAYTQNSERCKRPSSKERQAQVAELLSEFQHVTDYGQVDNFYDKIAKFIDHTHCHLHYGNALEAFVKWKTDRIAAASSSSSTLVSNAIFSYDSLDSSSETSGAASPAHPGPVLGIEEEMRNLALNSNIQNATRQRSNGNPAQMQELRHGLEKLGTVDLPREGARQDELEIFITIKNPPQPRRMSDGRIYIYKHNNIPGILKIGYTTKSVRSRHRQFGNCYGIDTDIIYETENPFSGAFQAERIIHAVLRHKQIQIYNCSNCGSGHREWFLVSIEEARKIVECAESWLRMPAYTMLQGRLQLSPKAEVIYDSMINFSLDAMIQHIEKTNVPDNDSGVFSVRQLSAAIREVRTANPVPYAARNRIHTSQAGRTPTVILLEGPGEQTPVLRRAESALQTMDRDTYGELTQRHRSRSTNLDSDEDYNEEDESEESESGEDNSEIESDEFGEDEDDDDIENEESEEFDSGEEDVEEEGPENLGSDEEGVEDEADEPQEPHIDEGSNPARGFRARRRRRTARTTPNASLDVVKMLKAVRRGGAKEFRIIFPS
jgi:hypothetical protein